ALPQIFIGKEPNLRRAILLLAIEVAQQEKAYEKSDVENDYVVQRQFVDMARTITTVAEERRLPVSTLAHTLQRQSPEVVAAWREFFFKDCIESVKRKFVNFEGFIVAAVSFCAKAERQAQELNAKTTGVVRV